MITRAGGKEKSQKGTCRAQSVHAHKGCEVHRLSLPLPPRKKMGSLILQEKPNKNKNGWKVKPGKFVLWKEGPDF